MRMNGGQLFGGGEATLDPEVTAYDLNDPQGKQQAADNAVSLAMRLPGSSGSSMSVLATTAMTSAGDPGQLASVFTVMPAGDKKKVEMMQADVLAKAKSMAGVTAPLDFFDPAGFCTECSEGKLCFYREVELKHGRVAMLASLGFLVGEKFHPLFGGDIDAPSYIAFQQTPLQTFWPAVVAAIAIPEIYSVFTFNNPNNEADNMVDQYGDARWTMKTDRESGDLGFDPLGLKPTDPEELKQMKTKELNNGRLAMIAAAGMVAQELATGQKLF
jgi:light-harvesting complex I chlorophyll a/b binding protein 4